MIQNKCKKLIAMLISLIMIAAMFSTNVFAENTSSYLYHFKPLKCGDNVVYSFDSYTGSLTIYGEGRMYDYENKSPFSEVETIKSITIYDGVTSIGDNAFLGCTGLTSVTIGNSVTEIGNCAFLGCIGLREVTIPNVISIGESAFLDCRGLISVTIPNVTYIGDCAFLGCTSLREITIPNSVTDMGESVFDANTKVIRK